MSTYEIAEFEQNVVALSHRIAELPSYGRADVRERPGLRPAGDGDE